MSANDTDAGIRLRLLLRRLNPNRPASDVDDALPRVDRGVDALRSVATYLRADPNAKLLIAGHVGVGKSTELVHLGRQFETDFAVVYHSVSGEIGAHNASVPTLLVSLLHQVVRRWTATSIPMPKGLVASAYELVSGKGMMSAIADAMTSTLRTGTGGREPPRTGVELEHYLARVVHQISLQYFDLEQRRSEDVAGIAAALENMLKELADAVKKPLLLLIDDLDKIAEEDAALDIFVDRAMAWIKLPCAVVATLPINLYFHERAREIDQIWNSVELLDPLAMPLGEDADAIPPSASFYLTLLRNVGGDTVFSARQTSRLARDSGGVVRDFVHLCASCVHSVLDTGEEHVRDWHISAVEAQRTEKYQSRLLDEDYERLDSIIRTQRGARTGAQLIRDGVLLSQRDEKGKRTLCAHPLVAPLVEDYRRRRTPPAGPLPSVDPRNPVVRGQRGL